MRERERQSESERERDRVRVRVRERERQSERRRTKRYKHIKCLLLPVRETDLLVLINIIKRRTYSQNTLVKMKPIITVTETIIIFV